MLSLKTKYRSIYYDGFLMPKMLADVSIYEYLILGRDYIWDNLSMSEKTLTLMKLTDGHGEQLVMTVDRDFFNLNWQRYEAGEKTDSITVKHWQSLSEFESFSQKDIELWMLLQWEEFRKKHASARIFSEKRA